jgi:hypothetical protein
MHGSSSTHWAVRIMGRDHDVIRQHPYDSTSRSKVPLAMAFHADVKTWARFPNARNHLAHFVEDGGRELPVISGIGPNGSYFPAVAP